MMIPSIRYIEINGHKISSDRITKILRGSGAEDILQYIYDRFGVSSEEFIFAIQGFVYKILVGYGIECDYDFLMDAICCVLDRVKREYNPCKGKLTSFIYTIVRGEITKWRNKMKYCNVLVVDDGQDDDGIEEEREVDEELCRLKYMTDTIYGRAEMWEMIKGDLIWK